MVTLALRGHSCTPTSVFGSGCGWPRGRRGVRAPRADRRHHPGLRSVRARKVVGWRWDVLGAPACRPDVPCLPGTRDRVRQTAPSGPLGGHPVGTVPRGLACCGTPLTLSSS
ncbi:hypothetical protein UO65_0463 [Actinokineospora spheciospongiae]|uniref:Uncharacterized protein n=1 Tax=Actinokineospora spheciospongiae TaxID=909613 RepID=W7J534_9PSEU|nr:hypothetical protein UO65_0463 [Actinokineospora spheciospongiae]